MSSLSFVFFLFIPYLVSHAVSFAGFVAKPLWTLRPKSGIPPMYGNDVRMQEAKDPETDAFYNGGKRASLAAVVTS